MRKQLIKCYLYTDKDDQVVCTKMRMPCDHMESPSKGYKTREGYMKAIERWRKTFIHVINAYYSRKSSHIIIDTRTSTKSEFEDSGLIGFWGRECIMTLEKTGARVILVKDFGKWQSGHGMDGNTPDKAIKLYNIYLKWLKTRKPKDIWHRPNER